MVIYQTGNACIVAVQVKRTSRSAAATAGTKPVSAETELFKWLDEQEEMEKQHVLQQLFKRQPKNKPEYQVTGRRKK